MKLSAITPLNFKKANTIKQGSKKISNSASMENYTNFSSNSSNAIKSMNSMNINFTGVQLSKNEKSLFSALLPIEKSILESLKGTDKKEITEEVRQKALVDLAKSYKNSNKDRENECINAKKEVLNAITSRPFTTSTSSGYKALFDILTYATPENKDLIKKALSLKNVNGLLNLNVVNRLCCHDMTTDVVTNEEVNRVISPFEAKMKIASYENFVINAGVTDDDFIGQWPIITSTLRSIMENRGNNPTFYHPSARSSECCAEIIKKVNQNNVDIFAHSLANSDLSLRAIVELFCRENDKDIDDTTAKQRYKALLYMQSQDKAFKGEVDEEHKLTSAIREIIPFEPTLKRGKTYTDRELQNRVDAYMYFIEKYDTDINKAVVEFKNYLELNRLFKNMGEAEIKANIKQYIETRKEIKRAE